MIKITYHRTKHRVTVHGHAGFDKIGKDIVCAAIASLTYTLAKNCVNAEEDKRMRDVKISLEEGNADISCVPCKKLDSVVMLIFDTVCVGYEILALTFPEHVAFQVV